MAMSADMSGMSTTMTTSSAAPTSTAMSMGGMDGMNACKISMLWNWNTIDACFIARSWQVRTTAQFAGSCIGVILLVVTLEALRRAAKEYDAYLVRKHVSRQDSTPASPLSDQSKTATVQTIVAPCAGQRFRPNVLQQGVRALLHMLQFAVAYFVMLMAMYFNGYIIICILIGAFIGAFAFSWQSIDASGGLQQQREITYCCG